MHGIFSLSMARGIGRGTRGVASWGDSICTSPMCSEGKARVKALRDLLERLVSDGRIDRARWEPAVAAIEAKLDDATSFLSAWLPFNPSCCTARDIGREANALGAQLAKAAGIAPIPDSDESHAGALIALGVVLTLGLLGLGAYALHKAA